LPQIGFKTVLREVKNRVSPFNKEATQKITSGQLLVPSEPKFTLALADLLTHGNFVLAGSYISALTLASIHTLL
jgi:hypothetical protein